MTDSSRRPAPTAAERPPTVVHDGITFARAGVLDWAGPIFGDRTTPYVWSCQACSALTAEPRKHATWHRR